MIQDADPVISKPSWRAFDHFELNMVQLTMSVRAKGPEFIAYSPRNGFPGNLESGRARSGLRDLDHLHQSVYWGGARQRSARVVKYDPEKIFDRPNDKDYSGGGETLYYAWQLS